MRVKTRAKSTFHAITDYCTIGTYSVSATLRLILKLVLLSYKSNKDWTVSLPVSGRTPSSGPLTQFLVCSSRRSAELRKGTVLWTSHAVLYQESADNERTLPSGPRTCSLVIFTCMKSAERALSSTWLSGRTTISNGWLVAKRSPKKTSVGLLRTCSHWRRGAHRGSDTCC